MRVQILVLLFLLAGCTGAQDDAPTAPDPAATSDPTEGQDKDPSRSDATTSGTASPYRCPDAPGAQLIEGLLVNATIHGDRESGWRLGATICNNSPDSVSWTQDSLGCGVDWRLELTDADGTTRPAGWPGNPPNAGACATTTATLDPLETLQEREGWDGKRWYTATTGSLDDAPPGDHTLTWTFQPDTYRPETVAFSWRVSVGPAPSTACGEAASTQRIGALVVTATAMRVPHGWDLNATICNEGEAAVSWTRDRLTCRVDWQGEVIAPNGSTYWTRDRQNPPNAGACPDAPFTLEPGETVRAYDGWDGYSGYRPANGTRVLEPGPYTLRWTFVPDTYAPQTLAWEWQVTVPEVRD